MNYSLFAVLAMATSATLSAQTPPATPADHLTRFVNGLDIQGRMNTQFQNSHVGSTTTVAMSTTACNPGTVRGTWEAAPDPDHPFICQMYCRLVNGRFEQISDWSYVKHSFGSTNSNECGLGCQGGASFSQLGINCSDTYGASLNASRSDLGPPSEINSWTGEWVMFGSHFDVGFPVTAPNGSASQINPTSSVQFRAAMPDSKLATSGATYFGQVYYLHKWEPEANRENNMSSRRISITTTTASSLSNVVYGSVLANNYTGARVESAANTVGGIAYDGRFYVGVHVSQNQDGTYHYEYAIQNRDNHGRNAELRIPLCTNASYANVGFKDVDQNAANDWTVSRTGGELVFSAPLNNPQPWNTIYNVWFDSDAAPVDGDVTIYQGTINPGAAATVTVASDVPGLVRNVDLGGACSSAAALTLTANGGATIPNPTFALTMGGAPNGGLTALHVNFDGAAIALPGCGFLAPVLALPGVANASGETSWAISIPNDAGLEGSALWAQGISASVGGAIIGVANISNQLKVRVGNSLTGCN